MPHKPDLLPVENRCALVFGVVRPLVKSSAFKLKSTNCMYYVCHMRVKNIGLVTGPGGLFATRLVTESGGLATNPPCDKPVEDYSTLHRGLRQGFVTEGPRQRFVREGGGTATNPYFEALPYIYIHISTYIHIKLTAVL